MQPWSEIVRDLQTNWPIYVSMPVIAGVIGWFTKIVAIRMMFRPHRFRGIGPLGWQGIIPRRAAEMVEVLCQTLTGRLISAGEIIDRIDGDDLAHRIDRPLRKEIAAIVPKVAAEYQPTVWNLLPGAGRDAVVQRVQEVAPAVIVEFILALRENIDEVFDLKEMVTREFLEDPDILERMFLDVGRREFAFIRRSGLAFGFAIGVVQALIWALFHEPLVMPIFGLFIGWFTDWAALRLIFEPKEPTRYLGLITWQGLFLKHRIPVSEEYGVLIAGRGLTAERLVRSVLTGPGSERVAALLAPIIEETVREEMVDIDVVLRRELRGLNSALGDMGDTVGTVFGALTGAAKAPLRQVGSAGLSVAQVRPMCEAAAADLLAVLPDVLHPSTGHLDEVLDIRETMSAKMVAMTPDQFEGVLRPAFQQDERTLIVVGALLGFLVGELQVLLVEHLSR